MQHILKFGHVQKLTCGGSLGFFGSGQDFSFDFTLLLLNKIRLTEGEVIARKYQTAALDIKAEVLDFPAMTERTRLIFFYYKIGLFSAVLKRNAIKQFSTR